MKCKTSFLLLGLLTVGHSVTLKAKSPVHKVVTLLTELKTGVEADGKKEQQSYDKYACWCEETLARKAVDIDNGKKLIEEMQTLILKLKGDLGAHGAEIQQLKKDIAENKAAQKEATELRNKENSDFEGSKNENEQCIGALEAAIKVLTGAGAGKGFLQMQEARLMSIVGGVRTVLSRPLAQQSISMDDAEAMRKFVSNPDKFLTGSGTSALQVGQKQNPFGDYAPQSTQIQGILKGMYDAFTADLEKSNAEEADQQKGFEELMATKKKELATLQSTLNKQERDVAEKNKKLADSKTTRDDAKDQLKADEIFFEETKEGCKKKAKEWSNRSRLRTEELTGINKAIEILSSEEARKTFDASHTTMFLQEGNKMSSSVARSRAFTKLSALARKFNDLELSQVAVQLKTGGHFDKVFVMIDKMIALLRKEEEEDIAHRDRCQGSSNKNKNDMEDLNKDIEDADAKIESLTDKSIDLKNRITAVEEQIATSEQTLEEMLSTRQEEIAQFKKALKDDADAVALIEQAIAALAEFYKNNKIPLELVQQPDDVEYTVDPDKAPETRFEDGDYGGRKSESTGIISILEMIKEDTENEMKTSKDDEADAQAEYKKERDALRETLDAQHASKVAAEKERAEVEQKKADTEEEKNARNADLAEEDALQKTLEKDCKWVKTHFDTRREKRKKEMEGLNEAKSFLSGANYDPDDDLE